MASFVARLVEKAGGRLPENPRNAFTDDDTSFHQVSINKLAEAGLVDGKGGGRFAPKETVSRAQMAKFIVNAYEFVSPMTLLASGDQFGDDNGDTLESFINRSAAAGFTGRPQRPLRAEAAGAARPDGVVPGPDAGPAGRRGHHARQAVAPHTTEAGTPGGVPASGTCAAGQTCERVRFCR
jgi:hypothetical protein